MIFYPRHIGDWIKDTSRLSLLEEAAYSRLVDQYYALERPLPAAPAELYRLARARTRTERAAVDYVVATFFVAEDDGLHQRRCDAELQAYQGRASKARRGAALRWQQPGTARAATEQMPAPCAGTASHKPITIKPENNVVVRAHAGAAAGAEVSPPPPATPDDHGGGPGLAAAPLRGAMAAAGTSLAGRGAEADALPEWAAERFAMHAGWQPGPDFAQRLAQAGLAPPTPVLLAEFVSYRISTGARQTQAVWEHKFLLRLEQLARLPVRGGRSPPLLASPAERVRAAAARAGFARREPGCG